MRHLFLLLSVILAATGVAQNYGWQKLEKPKSGYVLDEAHLLAPETIRQINIEVAKCEQSTGLPVMVVTISSLHDVQAYGSIETYAERLFNAWEIGSGRNNRAALFLISPGDRKARIELGAHWGHEKDSASRTIMDNWIVPRFKENDYNGGALVGTKMLADMIRTGTVPTVPRKWWFWPLISVFGSFGLWIFYDLIRFGRRGRVWDFFRHSGGGDGPHRGYGSSSSSGGGDSGGSSGGGGATGSW